jgi:hypothetical protein
MLKPAATVTSPPENLMERIQWQLARIPVTADADKNTKANQAARRIKFGMNPDLRQPGF